MKIYKDNEDDYADEGGSEDDDENNVKGGPSCPPVLEGLP